MKKFIFAGIAVFAGIGLIASCGSSPKATTSGLSNRAFISNPLARGVTPELQIVNAQNDSLSLAAVPLAGALTQPGTMTLSPNKRYTLVYSPISPAIALVDNTTEHVAANGAGGNTTAVTLPGLSDSMFIANDNATAYVAVPSAANQTGELPGAVLQVALLNSTISATVAIPSAHYIVPSNDGNSVLVFSDNSDAITVINPILVGTNANPLTTIQSPNLDRPVWAIFSADGSVAYIFNCGPECGGKKAGIAVLQLIGDTVSTPVPVAGATTGLLNGSILYVAGSAPGTACGSGTAAKACGSLNLINTNSMTLINNAPISITDGRHNHMELSADGQLFIGANSCSNVNISGGEQRGCLTIYNSTASTTVFPPFVGDVTGIAPILGRQIVYTIVNGVLRIFDTTTDQINDQSPQPLFVGGLPYDVKYVDPAVSN